MFFNASDSFLITEVELSALCSTFLFALANSVLASAADFAFLAVSSKASDSSLIAVEEEFAFRSTGVAFS